MIEASRDMNLLALPAFADNYIWMFHDGHNAVVVDPGDAAPVLAALDALALNLHSILVTHHHADHVGGVNKLRSRLSGLVYGPANETIPTPFVPLQDGAVVDVMGLQFEVMDVPGHTAGHIAYFQKSVSNKVSKAPWLFCGDTLFSAGCGRLFEGTPAQMHHSLSRLGALPADTQVCCTHEYTLSNLKFAAAVEPLNIDISQHTARCQSLRQAGQPTLPSSIAQELKINPFLRCAEVAVQSAARLHGAAANDPVSVLGALREWKNNYR
jgi:hydroxyacylglutathione hydrolase